MITTMVNNTRRKRSTASNGRREEKPNVSEVTSEKEENDRLEAASVLSSFIFLPPKSDQNENSVEKTEERTSNPTSANLTYLPNSQNSGIPVSPHHRTQGRQSRRGRGKTSSSASAHEKKTSELIAQLNSHLKKHPILSLPQNQNNVDKLLGKDIVPLDVSSGRGSKYQSHNTEVAVTKSVASALRQAVSNNLKAAQPASKVNDHVSNPANSDHVSDPIKVESCEVDIAAKKKEGSDTNLPLKKRRLIGVDADSENLNSGFALVSMGSLTSWPKSLVELQHSVEHSSNHAKECAHFKDKSAEVGYRPVKFDPRTSLMVLQDVKVALTPDEDGDLPIHIAVVHENLVFVKKFIHIMAISGKTVDRYNKLQQTPLHLAILVNKPDIVEVLLKAGANPNLVDRNGCTAVHLSVCKQYPECLDTILRCSVVPPSRNSRDYEGYYPLHTCVELNDLDAMRTLINYEADIDVQDGKAGRSVLFYATEFNRSKIVELLLQHGANAEIQNYAGISALVIAQCNNNHEIVNMLRQTLDLAMYGETCTETKKLQLPRIHGKPVAALGEPGKPFNLESNSSYRSYSRQSSVSSNSTPMDLSLPKNKESIKRENPEKGQKHKPKKKMRKDTKSAKPTNANGLNAVNKDKHASLIAALQGPIVETKHANINEPVTSHLEKDIHRIIHDADADIEANHEYGSEVKRKSLYLHETSHDTNETYSEMETEESSQMINTSRRSSVESDNSNEPEHDVDNTDKKKVNAAESNSKDAGFLQNDRQTTSVGEEITATLDSQRQLLSQPVLLTRFSDLLKSISGPLKSEDIFEMIRPLIQFPIQSAVPKQPDSLSHQGRSKVILTKTVESGARNDTTVKIMENDENSASGSQGFDGRFVNEQKPSPLKEEAGDIDNESNLVIDEAEAEQDDDDDVESCKDSVSKGRNKPKSANNNEAKVKSAVENAYEHNAIENSKQGQCVEQSNTDSDMKASAKHSEELRNAKANLTSAATEHFVSKDSNNCKPEVCQNLPVDSPALKSTTLFYKDGSGYKPIKIFIDDSEQSSLVLQKLLETCVIQPSLPTFSTQLNEAKKVGNQANVQNIQPQKPLSGTQSVPAGQSVVTSQAVLTDVVNRVTTVQPSVQSFVSRTIESKMAESRVNAESPPLRPGLFALKKSFSMQKARMISEQQTVSSETTEAVKPSRGLDLLITDKSSLSHEHVNQPNSVVQPVVSCPVIADTCLVTKSVELCSSLYKTSSVLTKTSFPETVTTSSVNAGPAQMSQNAKDSVNSLNVDHFNLSRSVVVPSKGGNANIHSLTPVSKPFPSAIVTLPIAQTKSFQNVYIDSVNAASEKSTTKPLVFTTVTPVNVLMQKSGDATVMNSLQSFSTTNSSSQAKDGVLKNQVVLAPKPLAPNFKSKLEKPVTDSVKVKQKSNPSGYPQKLEKTSSAEGTLTRVNPDVKNRLSKALQSPQRKQIGVSSPGGSTENEVPATDAAKSIIPDIVQPISRDDSEALTLQEKSKCGVDRTPTEDKMDESEVEMAVDNLKEQMESETLSQGSESDEHVGGVSTENTIEDNYEDNEDKSQSCMEHEDERNETDSAENGDTNVTIENSCVSTVDTPNCSDNITDNIKEEIKHALNSEHSEQCIVVDHVNREHSETCIKEDHVNSEHSETCTEEADVESEQSDKCVEEADENTGDKEISEVKIRFCR